MASATDSGPVFFSKATPEQWSYVLSQYKEVLKEKAASRTKKGGPEELIRLDTWYQEQLPKIIQSRKPPHIVHEELIQIVKWKLMRGKFRPRLTDLVRINTETAVKNVSKKAFRKKPKDLSQAITGLTNLKGVGPATASAILAAAFPEIVPYMADESMLSTPGIEATDYTLAEYLNYAEHIKACSDRLNHMDPSGNWTPHNVELTLWTHYLARDLKPSILEGMPPARDPPAANGGAGNGAAPPNGASVDSEDSADKLSPDENTNDSLASSENTNEGIVQSEESTNEGIVQSEESTNEGIVQSEESTNDQGWSLPCPANDSADKAVVQSEESTSDSGKENVREGSVGESSPTTDVAESGDQPPAKKLCVEQQ